MTPHFGAIAHRVLVDMYGYTMETITSLTPGEIADLKVDQLQDLLAAINKQMTEITIRRSGWRSGILLLQKGKLVPLLAQRDRLLAEGVPANAVTTMDLEQGFVDGLAGVVGDEIADQIQMETRPFRAVRDVVIVNLARRGAFKGNVDTGAL